MALPRGKPFEKGTDTRRTPGGRTKAQAAFSRSLKEYIIKHGETTLNVTVNGKPKKLKRIEAVVRAVYNEAIGGNMQAVTFIADRVEGKIKDELEQSGQVNIVVEYAKRANGAADGNARASAADS